MNQRASFNFFNPYEPTKETNFRASIYVQADHIQRVVDRLTYIEDMLYNFRYFDRQERFKLVTEREYLLQQKEQFEAHCWITWTWTLSPARLQSFTPSRFGVK